MCDDGYALINNDTSKNMIYLKCYKKGFRVANMNGSVCTVKPCGARVDFYGSVRWMCLCCACMYVTINTFNKRMMNAFHCFPKWIKMCFIKPITAEGSGKQSKYNNCFVAEVL